MERRTWFTPRQEQLLRLVGQDKKFTAKFYLTGGTALAGCYYNHRFSEDLDFFTPYQIEYKDLVNTIFSSKVKLGWKMVEKLQTNINGFKLSWGGGETLLIDFVFYAFPRIAESNKVYGISIDSISDICANKLETILLRSKARDFVDLYTIMVRENFDLDKVRQIYQTKYETKISNIELAKNLLKVNEVSDYPVMKIEFDKIKMIEFFENEARKMGAKILKK